jgi:hypothetical protein
MGANAMTTLTRTPAYHMRAAIKSSRRGGQPGNKNATKKDPTRVKDSFLAIRCKTEDKSTWVKAANLADRAGELDGREESVLAAWVIRKLNAASENVPRPKKPKIGTDGV